MASFELTIDKWVNDVTAAIELTFQEVVIDLGESLVFLTPVLTGRLRGNWLLTRNVPANNSVIRYDQSGEEVMAEIREIATTLSAGDVAYIVNNLMYSERIEYGGTYAQRTGSDDRPMRTPAAMLATTEDRFETILAEVALRNQV